MLQDGVLPGGCYSANQCATGALFRSYLGHTNLLNDRRKRSAETLFGIFLKKHVPGLVREKAPVDYIDGRGERETNYQYAYTLPPLTECRRAFCVALGQDIKWADEDPEYDRELSKEMQADIDEMAELFPAEIDRDWEKGPIYGERAGC
jgi:hypothetical protein